MVLAAMQKIEVNGAELAIWDIGSGEPVLFVHGAFGDQCMAVLTEPALTDNYRVVHYQQRGWGYSASPDSPPSIEQKAADCRAVLEQLGIDRVHLVASSAGGMLALQTALDYPYAVHTFALLEPVLPDVLGSSPELAATMQKVGSLYQTGDTVGAVDAFARELGGENYQADLNPTLPAGWLDRWAAELDTLIQYDMPGSGSWTFTQEDAARITIPVLNMTVATARPYFSEVHERLQSWFPQAENVVLPDATHLMLESNPKGAAEHLAGFFSRHPMSS